MAPQGEQDGGDAQQQGEQPLVPLEAERQDGGDHQHRRQAVEPRRRQAEAEQHRRAGEQDGEDHEQDAEPPLAVRLPPTSPLRPLRFAPRHHVASYHAAGEPSPLQFDPGDLGALRQDLIERNFLG
jgi:hypothetical protein